MTVQIGALCAVLERATWLLIAETSPTRADCQHRPRWPQARFAGVVEALAEQHEAASVQVAFERGH